MLRESKVLPFTLMLCAVLASGPSLGQEGEPRYWDIGGVEEGDALVVHSSGSVQSSVVALLPADAICLKNLGCRGGLTQKEIQTLNDAQQQAVLRKRPRWCQVAFGNRRGWVAQKFLVPSTNGCVIDRRI
jgi:hypothetical protein